MFHDFSCIFDINNYLDHEFDAGVSKIGFSIKKHVWGTCFSWYMELYGPHGPMGPGGGGGGFLTIQLGCLTMFDKKWQFLLKFKK